MENASKALLMAAGVLIGINCINNYWSIIINV